MKVKKICRKAAEFLVAEFQIDEKTKIWFDATDIFSLLKISQVCQKTEQNILKN